MSTQDLQTTPSASNLSADDIHRAIRHMEHAMRMLGQAIHRFSELRAVNAELRYDPNWTDFEVRMRQSLAEVARIIRPH